MNTTFLVGDLLIASPHAKAQGFLPDEIYRVVEIQENPTPFGSLCNYLLARTGRGVMESRWAGNAHLLFRRLGA